VSVVIEEYSYDMLLVQIIDNGKGICQKDLDQIFMMYGRISQYQSNLKSQGIGLGLSTAK